MMMLNDANFHRALKSPKLVVMFSAKWAGPCNTARPAFEAIASRYDGKLKIAEFDIDDNPVIPQKYGVRALPCFVLFEDGVPTMMKVGAIPDEIIVGMMDELLEA